MGGPADHASGRSDGVSESSNAPSEIEISNQLEKILSSPEFATSARLQKLLRYIVTKTLAGNADELKEYTIAVDVFDRDESFDPQTSSIVRVEASRLRGKLEKYNAISGRNDPVRIDLPAGAYIPNFSIVAPSDNADNLSDSAETDGSESHSSARHKLTDAFSISFFAVVTILIAVVAFSFWPRSERAGGRSASDQQALTVAVLPLRNFSGDPAEDYFSQGMTDALITRLAQERIAHVTSMTSVMAFKDSNQPIANIGNQLGATHLVEGSVMRVDDKVRITVQLIEAVSDRHLWADSYERGMSDVLRLQDDVVERIVSSVAKKVTSGHASTSNIAPDIDPVAYEAYLKGRFFLNLMTEDGFRKGISFFKQSIETAPEYAPSHSGMAVCYCLLGGHGFEIVKPSEGMLAAKKGIMEALRLDSARAEPHAFLGIIQLKYDWDWQSAKDSFDRAVEINPSYARAHIFYSYYHEAMGDKDAAIRASEIARRLDPLSRATNINLGWQYLQAGQHADALEIFAHTAELYPNHWSVHWGIGQYHMRVGENDKAIAAFQKAYETGGGHAMPISALGYAYAVSGNILKANEAIKELEALGDDSYVSPYHLATIYAGLKENDKAFVLLNEAYDLRSRSIAWLQVAPEMDSLRSDPRFNELLRRVGLIS